jgi:hypothetical protein
MHTAINLQPGFWRISLAVLGPPLVLIPRTSYLMPMSMHTLCFPWEKLDRSASFLGVSSYRVGFS